MRKFTFLFLSFLISYSVSFSQNVKKTNQTARANTYQPSTTVNPTVIRTALDFKVTIPLSEMPTSAEVGPLTPEQIEEFKKIKKEHKLELNAPKDVRNYPFFDPSAGPDPAWQQTMGTKSISDSKAPLLNFAGQTCGASPPDCNGAAGPNHFMQAVNSTYVVYNKSGVALTGMINFNTLFNGVAGASRNDGDPIVLYDEQADRWLVAEFSLDGTYGATTDRMLVAVSTTNNPLGTWYAYSFDVDDMPDYMKFGVWQDGYYMATNNSTAEDVYVFERSVMLAGGASPQMVGFDNPNRPASGFHCIMPLDNDGAFAPAGEPGQFITINDGAWGGADQLWIYELDVNWTTPASSTFARTQTIGVNAFDSNFGATWDNIGQPGTAQEVDAIPQILMFRAQYRNWGTNQTIVCAHTVDVDNTDRAGIRWYELQNTGTTWSVRQQGTYSPSADDRWIPSIAMDANHNIGLGYNVANTTSIYPSIRYCGQSATENAAATGVMDIAEESIIAGTSSKTDNNRWGDYAEMCLDPTNDLTFWFTSQYSNGAPTRIATFQFAPITTPPNTNFTINTPNTIVRPVPILQGSSATFTDLTTGTVDSYLWAFESGTPATATTQNPGTITYNTVGEFNVSLTTSNIYGDSTLTRQDYIKVYSTTAETCDTLVQFIGNPTIYTSTNGYVGGTNEYGCAAISEKFTDVGLFNEVYGGRFYWAAANNGTSPNVTFVMWAPDASGNPGTQLATTTIPLATIVNDYNTVGYTDVNFGSEIPIPTDGFFIGFLIPGTPASGDTLAILTNNDINSADNTGYSLYGTTWETYDAWTLSLMNAIIAFACYDPFLPPVANFSGTPTTVMGGSTVAFTDLSYGGTPTSWSWTFVGGTPGTATTQNPTITYNTPGYYAVTLTATNANGSDSETKTNYIHVLDPNACNCSQLDHVVGNEVVYTTTGGYLSGSNEYADKVKAEYFADYAPFTRVEGVYIRFGAVHVANTATNITINLYDDNGAASGGGTHTFSPGTVLATKTVPITTIAADVAAGDTTYIDFTTPVTITGPFFIGFVIPTPSATSDSIAVMTGVQGAGTDDGWEQWSDNVWYSYTEAGWGGSFNNAIYPAVCSMGSPLADFTANTTTVGAGQSVTFTDMSYCTPTSWSWTLPGGTPATATTQNPVITYNTPGTYDVTLQATNATGSGTELKTQYITVLSPIVYWNFPNNPDNATSDGGIAANNGTKSISVVGGVTAPTFATAGATTRCASAVGWASGSGLKYWQVNFETTGYGDLIFSSKMAGNNVRSASDFNVQYRVGAAGVWTDVPAANIDITAINNWTVGNLANIALPVACENQADVYLRWIMTTNTGINGTQSVQAGNATYIDDIYVYGVSLSAPPVANFTASTTSGCEGVSITFTDASTNTPTSWAWDFGGGATNSTLQNPTVTFNTAGTYTITLTATNAFGNDSEVKTSYITIWDKPTATTSVTNVACFGGATGTATATVAGGTAPFNYLWNDPAPAQTTATCTALTAGTWSVTVTDSHTCTATASATVTQPAAALSASIGTFTNVSCNGGNNGSATVTATGGTAPYTYDWSPNGYTGDGTATYSLLIAGTYTVTVTDANGCTTSVNRAITQPSALTATMGGTNVSCFGGTNGTATVTAAGGTAPYTYDWSPNGYSGDGTATYSTLIAGTYTVTVTDANGCTATGSRVVTQPTAVTATITAQTNVSCFGGANGTATVTAAGGTAPYTYLWNDPAPAQSNATATALTAGTWTVTVTATGGCTATANVTITQPVSAVTSSITAQTNVSCFGGATGSATVTAAGGTPGYTYLWNDPAPAQTTATCTALTAGTWTVTVTDFNSCTSTSSVTITQPASALTSSITAQTNVSCFGGTNGSATVTAAGGTAPYGYLWNDPAPAQITATATALTAGTWTVTVTDANSCTSSSNVTITQPAALTASITAQTNVSCFGGSNGSATATPVGGTAPYTYLWNDPAPAQTTATATALTAGTWTVTVTSTGGCTTTTSATITQPASALTSSISAQTNVSCFGGSNGSATVTATGGTAPYGYLWNDPAPAQTTATCTALTAATWTVTVTDANSCTSTSNVTITQPTALTASITAQTNVSCNGGTNGTATVTAAGGTAPYTYLWNDPAPAQTTATATSLIAGTWTVTVTSTGGCTATASVTITQPAVLAVVMTGANASCNGTCNGTGIATPSGGTSPYNYSWNDPGFQTAATATGLCAGTFNVTVTDANSCTVSGIRTVTQPSAIVLSTSTVSATCGNSDGSATVTASGGTSPYTYLWNDPAPAQTTPTATGLASGSYSVTVTDNVGCTASATANISDAGAPTATISSSANASCNGVCDGTAAVTVIGGTAPYNYLWSTGGTGNSVSGLCDGTVSVNVTDAIGCNASASVVITEPAVLVATVTASTNATCNGTCNGTATVSVSGGTTTYNYLWDNGQTVANATALCAGTHAVTVTDSHGCTASATRVITQPAALTASTTATNVSCNGGANGTATVTAAGGTSPYTYLWNDPAPVQTTPTASALTAGTWSVTVTDANGCTTSVSATVNQPAALTAGTTSTNVSCFGGANGSATVTAAGGTSPYSYLWNDPAPAQTTPTATALTSGTWTVTITDANSCTTSANAIITQPSALTSAISAQANVSCFGGANGSATVTASGGTSPYSYLWNDPAPAQTTPTATALTAGTYGVTVTDFNSCTSTTSVVITQPAVLTATTTVTNVSCNGGANGTATITATGGTSPYNYLWNDPAPVQTTATCTGLSSGSWCYTVTDVNGCWYASCVTITQPAALLATATSTNVSCNGGSNGTATASVSGGTSPYNYVWNDPAPAQTTVTATALTAGTWTVTATDANGCTASANTTITQPSALTATITSTVNVTVAGGSDGSATVTASGGTSPYSYLWNDPAPAQTTATATGLISGTYTVTVTDANGCTTTASATINEPGVLIVSITASTNVTCSGACNGTISAWASGGITPYGYSWSNSSTSPDLTGLCAGTYSVTVTDANFVTASASVTITEPSVLDATTTVTNVLCNGGFTGSASVSSTGGTPGYSYLWSEGTASSLINGIQAGTYSVVVTDASGCTVERTAIVTEPAALSLTVTGTNMTCFGICDGTATASVSGGTVPYSYLWTDPSVTTLLSVFNLCAGLVTVNITDGNGCVTSGNYTVIEPADMVLTMSGSDETCSNANGTASASVTGGTPIYTYLWDGGAVTDNITGLVAGVYNVTVTDANACVKTGTYTVNNHAAPVLSISGLSNVSCFGICDGAATVDITGGTLPVSYSWSNGTLTATDNALCAGTYSVVVTDASGCTSTTDVTITEPAELIAGVTTTDVTCYGELNGEAILTVTGGTPTYTYSWSTGGSAVTESGLAAGTYDVTVVDANGCSDVVTFDILTPAELVANMLYTDITCFADNNGTASVSVTGGVSPYYYEWSTGSTADNISALGAGLVSLTVTDDSGCSVINTVTINEPAPVIASILSLTDVVCYGECNGSSELQVTGGVLPYTYIWDDPAAQTDALATGLCAGEYNPVVTDANGCSATQMVLVYQPDEIVIYPVVTDANCSMSDGAISLSVIGGDGSFSYFWAGGETTSDLTGIPSGLYYVTVEDGALCAAEAEITVNDIGGATISVNVINAGCFGESTGEASLTITGGTEPFTYNWSTGSTDATVTGLAAGSYSVTVTDDAGCEAFESFDVTEPEQLVLTMSSTDEDPVGALNGTATVTISGGTPAFIIQWSNGENTETIGGLATGWYYVTVIDSYSCTLTDSVLVDFGISVAETETGSGYRIYPNPTNGLLKVELYSMNVNTIEVMDVVGKRVLVLEEVNVITEIDLSKFDGGVYFINLYSGDRKYTNKIILKQ